MNEKAVPVKRVTGVNEDFLRGLGEEEKRTWRGVIFFLDLDIEYNRRKGKKEREERREGNQDRFEGLRWL